MSSMGKNDIAWEKLFNKYKILEHIESDGIYKIESKDINEFREARLMTKFDHKNNLPSLFSKNKLSILPITRGSYVISSFEAYHKFEPSVTEIKKVIAPEFIRSIDFENITSESTALNVAYATQILADFTNEEGLLPTVSGRMSSESFDFNIKNSKLEKLQNISVVNSQIEIDGGYEGLDALTLIEAKNSLSDDFLIRQLYYPFRLWSKKIKKPVKPVFLTYSNGIFNLYEYQFQDPKNYNSLILIKQKNYTLEQENIELDEIVSLLKKVMLTVEPDGIPFPQADSFRRIINICELLNENESLSREDITCMYDFDIRQTNYYTAACIYLGLVVKEHGQTDGVKYSLTKKGKDIFKLNIKNRNLTFVKCILEKRVFNEVFKVYLKESKMPRKDEIINIMRESRLYNIKSVTTYNRRASTVSCWIDWILDLTR